MNEEPAPSLLSDGCSVPRALRVLIPYETGEQRLCCVAHDQAYARGGTLQDKALADARLLLCLLEAKMPHHIALQYHAAVVSAGASHWTFRERPAS